MATTEPPTTTVEPTTTTVMSTRAVTDRLTSRAFTGKKGYMKKSCNKDSFSENSQVKDVFSFKIAFE